MTLSIVARDVRTGQMGVAVLTGYLAVGQKVPWVEPGVGAVATQAITEASYGPETLNLLRLGTDPRGVLSDLLDADPLRESRQVGVVDQAGRTAAHTGGECITAAGHAVGEGVVAMANMVGADGAWNTMLDAYEMADGALTDRLHDAVIAGHRAGGDLRGSTSAAILTVSGDPGEPPWSRLVDLRVDDHPDPVDELSRLLRLHGMYALMGEGINAIYAGRHDQARSALHAAVEHELGDVQAGFWRAVAAFSAGDTDAAESLLVEATGGDPAWLLLWERLGSAGRGGLEPPTS